MACSEGDMIDQFSFSVTGYTGYEEEIIAIRNRNRDFRQTREYLDWRYLGETTDRPPIVFWIRDSDGKPLAMASLIFRLHIVNARKLYFGVLGDVSVNEEHRRQGLFTRLLNRINEYIIENKLPTAFVITTRQVREILTRAGWTTVGKVAPFICLSQPAAKLPRLFKVPVLGTLASTTLRAIMRLSATWQTKPEISLRNASDFDAEFQKFWDELPKENRILHDRSISALTWRYRNQPGGNYSIGKFYKGESFVGYVVTEMMEGNVCLLTDFLVASSSLVKPCLAAFLLEKLSDKSISTIRIALVDGSEFARGLWQLGFFPRSEIFFFQVYHPEDECIRDSSKWFVTAGDKDA